MYLQKHVKKTMMKIVLFTITWYNKSILVITKSVAFINKQFLICFEVFPELCYAFLGLMLATNS